jgi:hypothetical protein
VVTPTEVYSLVARCLVPQDGRKSRIADRIEQRLRDESTGR